MPRSTPTSAPQPPAAGGTYEVGKDGALVCVQQTADPVVISADPVTTTEDPQDNAAAN